jgi:hypothetical protein
LQVIYLLHGNDGTFRDWSNYSDVAQFAESGILLVMLEGGASYYTNAVTPPEDRYEDYIVNDLPSDVETRFAAAVSGRKARLLGSQWEATGQSNWDFTIQNSSPSQVRSALPSMYLGVRLRSRHCANRAITI